MLAVPNADPSDSSVGATIDRLRDSLPAGALVGGAVAENHDLEGALSAKTLPVFAVLLAERSASCSCSSRCRRR